MTPVALILASSSRFRQAQLANLNLPFESVSPDADERSFEQETPAQTALRLAILKAETVAKTHTNHLIIGSDQVAFCQNTQLGKPMSLDKAAATLRFTSGQDMDFYTAVVLLNTVTGRLQQHVDHTRVTMRALSDATIARYLECEPDAIYCAGGAKSEGLGQTLIESITTTDPNALIGLPMLKLIGFFINEGIVLP
ncbi:MULTISPECIES: Maf family protein [Vitreoscilla]|uniref:7-methyl-GTP pyrophosphatase n=1 Tax=Vitreoscilla stercoraria TaxID=61 RepID=A0ABY4ECF8_VITST|nr:MULTISPECIES: nucleoside triphosphate pyrophosphatase [Vitreoscilla]AUZ05513.1 septum formation protein Maf [Vitreoscilla sp. C1]UOO93074.1 Maf family nucleotide pyrophosphatase [Vitreoscilla stercoraria]